MIAILAAVTLIQVTGPDDQIIHINPADVVSVRPARSEEHFAAGIKCLIHTADGKFVAVVETCDVVLQRLGEE